MSIQVLPAAPKKTASRHRPNVRPPRSAEQTQASGPDRCARVRSGGGNIAIAIGDTFAATYHRLKRGLIPGARKEAGAGWVLHLPSYAAGRLRAVRG